MSAVRSIPRSITITRPDDWHLHVRDGDYLNAVLPHTAQRFARAIIMPNLKPPVTTRVLAAAYRQRILSALPRGNDTAAKFDPLMTLYLTDNTSPQEIIEQKQIVTIGAVKYYPAGATTNSDSGVTDLARCAAVLEVMQECGMPLLVHGEVTDTQVDIFDREHVFIERVLVPLIKKYPRLKVVMEHITTREAAHFVAGTPSNIAATITAHHLLLNRNALFAGGVRPHNYCLPVLKREVHREALVAAATSGNPKFFLGTDSAPHATHTKEADCGCAGCYTAYAGIELYAEAFAAANALDKLEGFASHFGADFYGLPRNTETITLVEQPWRVPDHFAYGSDRLTPFRAGGEIAWRVCEGAQTRP